MKAECAGTSVEKRKEGWGSKDAFGAENVSQCTAMKQVQEILYKCLQQQISVQFLCKRAQISMLHRRFRHAPSREFSRITKGPDGASSPRPLPFHKWSSLSSATFISFQSSSSGSQPTESRTKPSGTLSPQRARLSAEVCTPPKLVVGRINLQPLMNFSAEFLSLKVTPRIMAKRSIWLFATAWAGCDASPGNFTCCTLRCSARRAARASALLHMRSKRTSKVSRPR